jgi:hypothetical protein
MLPAMRLASIVPKAIARRMRRAVYKCRQWKLTRQLRQKGGRFRFEAPFCCCQRPMGVPCTAIVPHDYFTDVDYGTALWLHAKHTATEHARKTLNVKSAHGAVVVRHACALAGTSADLAVRPVFENPRRRRFRATAYACKQYSFPVSLSEDQIRRLSARTDEAWASFLEELPAKHMTDVTLFDDSSTPDMVARVMVTAQDRNDHCPRLQVHAAGTMVIRTADGDEHMHRGSCPWTRQHDAADARVGLVATTLGKVRVS